MSEGTEHVLPCGEDGSLLPASLLLQWLRRAHDAGRGGFVLRRLPYGNAAIPALCRLVGIERINLRCATTPVRWLWGGGRHRVVIGTEAPAADDQALHEGHLPPSDDWLPRRDPWMESIRAKVELARLEDAAAVTGGGDGTDWETILADLDSVSAQRPPPIAGHNPVFTPGKMRAWNPLPFARHATVALPSDGGQPPWGVEDNRGGLHPLQVVEGPLGPQWLTELDFGALECLDLAPYDQPVTGCHWEVKPHLLDNGRLRAEIDTGGRIERLCCDGVFLDLAGPIVVPTVAGRPLPGETTVEVLEAGPVRARVGVRIDGPVGVARITYGLHAGEDLLRISVAWHGRASELTVEHRLPEDAVRLRCDGELLPWELDLGRRLGEGTPPPQRGVSWAALLGPDGTARLGVLGGRPLALAAARDALLVHVYGTTGYALGPGAPRDERHSLGHRACALAVPARHAGNTKAAPPPFHLAAARDLVPIWADRPAGWRGQLLLAEQAGAAGRAYLYPHVETTAALLTDVHGHPLETLEATSEGDGWQLDYRAHDLLLLRWR